MINQEAADLYFGEKPLGTAIIDDKGVRTEIIGVVGSPGLGAFRRPTEPTVYFPMWQDCAPRMALIINAPNWNGRLLAELRRRVEAVPAIWPADCRYPQCATHSVCPCTFANRAVDRRRTGLRRYDTHHSWSLQ